MILLTTPDYLPKLGGLSSHTLNVEKVLKKIGLKYDLFHWKSYEDVLKFDRERLKSYEFIINIHSGFHMYMPQCDVKVVNFINGAEILFYSDHPVKQLLKLLTKKKALKRVEEAFFNFFISEFTFKTLVRKGLKANYSRDLVYHMAVDTTGHAPQFKKWDEGVIKFICVARDVPHKNFVGVIKFCEEVQHLSGRKVELLTLTNRTFTSNTIQISSHVNVDNQKRDELLAQAHINLLLSLDHSHKGFFEGFGQIVQEAGCFATPSLVLGTGGLPESVHDRYSGWVLEDLSKESIESWWREMNEEKYSKISQQCYHHTILSHGLESWERLFRLVMDK